MKITLKLVFCLLFVVSYAVCNAQLSGTINGHAYVDLGLSVKWSTCNVGANSPEEYGDYFAWGETSRYDYNSSKTTGENYGDIGRNSSTDAARANWGSSWRLPTKAEFNELITNCTWTWTTQGGYKVTSKKNGKSIFLPATGFHRGSSFENLGPYGTIGALRPTRVIPIACMPSSSVARTCAWIGAVAASGAPSALSQNKAKRI